MVANIGDSRAFSLQPDEFQVLTVDADPTVPHFKKTVQDQGGFVAYDRVNGQVAVARYIGNKSLGLNLAWPEFSYIDIEPGDLLMLSCDGLTERTANVRVASLARKMFDDEIPLGSIAAEMVKFGIQEGSTDNISVLLHPI